MRFKQKPPTKPGLYWAVANYNYGEGSFETIIELHGDGSVSCVKDACQKYGEYDELKRFIMFAGPINKPEWSMPKRIINYHPEPRLVPTPASCRRWGHKWVKYEPEPPDYTSEYGKLQKHLMEMTKSTSYTFREDVHEKCVRCGMHRSYNPTFLNFGLAIAMSENKLEDATFTSSEVNNI